jgi:hypothetical protein
MIRTRRRRLVSFTPSFDKVANAEDRNWSQKQAEAYQEYRCHHKIPFFAVYRTG